MRNKSVIDHFRYVMTHLTLMQRIVLISTMLFVTIGASFAVYLIEQRFQYVTDNTLTTVLNTADRSINVWANNHLLEIKNFSQSAAVAKAARALLDTSPDKASLLAAEAQATLRQAFRLQLSSSQYRGYFIISPDNINLASSRDDNLGIINLLTEQPDVLADLWAGKTRFSRLQTTDVPIYESDNNRLTDTFFVGTPLRDEKGRTIALFTLRIDPYETLFPILESGRLGNSGETYAFDKNARMLFF